MAPSTRKGLLAVALAGAALGLPSCGGGKGGGVTSSVPKPAPRVQPPELRWRDKVEQYVAGLTAELTRVHAGTEGGAKTAPVRTRIDPRVLVAGAQRRSFLAATAALGRCAKDLAAIVPTPPTERLQPVRGALTNACTALASAAQSLDDAVRASGGVDPGALELAQGQAEEGVRILLDALATLDRVLQARAGP